ncbi:nuclear transport factor 2 family protein [Agrococcus sp. SGAir0287]|uniref:nuclear transport factor 2 family protein n=1 Tax=Agrococcus sp. SGAir0287 TaxID=2070347 RepID=UPI0010CCF61A|nr:nuclear transport factor 2 family protein [Agrococcus sp. SGAir0287]QCR18924.1 polyketide cyclase [Agrococcus sp. SGAir0287]
MASIPEPVAAFVEAVNRHDSQAFLAAFTDDGFVDDWGRTFTGRDAIERWSDVEFIGSQGTLTPEQVTVAGDEVTIVGDWRSTHANGRSRFVFAMRGDRIASMTIREG